MIVSVVANGPSAAGKGKSIDNADKVVRIKAFWAHAAEDAGARTDAVAWFGDPYGWDSRPADLYCEHWYTHGPTQIMHNTVNGKRNLREFNKLADMQPIRWLTHEYWKRLAFRLKLCPSTGFIAVAMAMKVFKPDVLKLFGFDSTVPEQPHYYDARTPYVDAGFPHMMLKEKLLFAKILDGSWLGQPCTTQLCWCAMPDLVRRLRTEDDPELLQRYADAFDVGVEGAFTAAADPMLSAFPLKPGDPRADSS